VQVSQVRLPEHLAGLDGLIIPGGESTTIGKLATAYDLIDPLVQFAQRRAVWGTCAGAIFLSKDIHRSQPLLRIMDITVERNAFGRQVDSFEVDLDVPVLRKVSEDPQPYHAVFIRAPLIAAVEGGAEVLATLSDGRIVAAQQGRWLATSFHPELTEDDRFHRYFLALAAS
jgi:5'-phosphate synthase pdxT subunit